MTPTETDLTVLPRSESLGLLRSVPVGRIVFTDHALPAIAPVNFAVMGNGDVVIRTGPGSKLSAAIRQAIVAFQADQINDPTHEAWSVVVTGRARHVTSTEEIDEIDAVMPHPWAAGERADVVRISADIVEGRRLASNGVPA